jgi:hypothetical protein
MLITIQTVRHSESMVEAHAKHHPALLRLSAMISQALSREMDARFFGESAKSQRNACTGYKALVIMRPMCG